MVQKSHNHRISISGSASSAPAGVHCHGTWGEIGWSGPFGVYRSGRYAGSGGGTDSDNNLVRTSNDGIHTHSFSFNFNGTSAAAGQGTAHENRPPYYTLIYCVKCR